LVVIAIIGILIALLLPAVQKVREAANRMSCSNNLKQLSLGLHNYHNVNSKLPAGGITEGFCCATQSRTTWTIEVLPFLEGDNLYRTYDQGAFNEAPVNADFRTTLAKIFICPSDNSGPFVPEKPASGPGDNLLYMPGSYRAVSGRANISAPLGWMDNGEGAALPRAYRGPLHTVWSRLGLTNESFNTITDGLSNTLMLGEYHTRSMSRRRTFWAYTYTSYNQSSVHPASHTYLPDFSRCEQISAGLGLDNRPCRRSFGSFHTGGANWALCDGSVRFISYTVDVNLLANMATIEGNEAETINQ
jgi:prepilin-type processing-associated H-X9-DG protein